MPSSDPVILTTGADAIALATRLEAAWHQGRLVGLAQPLERSMLEAALNPDPSALHGLVDNGPGVVVGSGGTSGGRRWCLQPLGHLRASAEACGRWLLELGLEPASCLVLNPLPLHHVSGLLPLVRARQWGAELRWLPPALLRDPSDLGLACPLPRDRPVLL